MYYLLQQRLIKQGKLPSAFKVQQTPTKKKPVKTAELVREAENQPGKEERSGQRKTANPDSASVSPERRNRRQQLHQFEEIVSRPTAPRKSQTKAAKEDLQDTQQPNSR